MQWEPRFAPMLGASYLSDLLLARAVPYAASMDTVLGTSYLYDIIAAGIVSYDPRMDARLGASYLYDLIINGIVHYTARMDATLGASYLTELIRTGTINYDARHGPILGPSYMLDLQSAGRLPPGTVIPPQRRSTMVFNGPISLLGGIIGDGVTIVDTRHADGRVTRSINRAHGAHSPDVVYGDFVVHAGSPPLREPPTIKYPDEPEGGDPQLPDDHPRLCTLCLEREKRMAIVPCGHLYACITCIRASKPTTCAQCRKALTGFMRVFDT